MSDIKLFRITAGNATELQGDASNQESPLQTLIEANLASLLGIRFLATEYSSGLTLGGRIDSLGLLACLRAGSICRGRRIDTTR